MPLVCVDVVRSCFVVAGEQKGDQKSFFFLRLLARTARTSAPDSSRVVVHRTKCSTLRPRG